jgi:hypothetical protein
MVEDHRRTVISLLSFVVMITVLTSESIVQKTFKQDENTPKNISNSYRIIVFNYIESVNSQEE